MSVSDQPKKRKRKRHALSCVECKERKIKCDRNVPNCGSCLARGIQRRCRWGDERDEEAAPRDRVHSLTPPTGIKVDDVVDKVLKRLKGEEHPATPSSTSSLSPSPRFPSSPGFYQRPPVQAAANIIHTSAFSKFPSFHPAFNPDGRYPRATPKDATIDVERVKKSLRALPSKEAVERLVDNYLSELEPFRCSFNRVILQRQLADFWRDVDQLNIASQTLVWSDDERIMYPAVVSTPHIGMNSSFKLVDVSRQGFIAVLFTLLYSSLSSLSYEETVRMEVFPRGTTEAEIKKWSLHYHNLSQLHLTLSDYLEHPTIWTLQVLTLQKAYHMNNRAIHTSMVNMTTTLRLAVILGLNRLGSAVDDVRAMQKVTRRSQSDVVKDAEYDDEARSNVTGPMFGVTIASFEEGNLAMRELGRKIWTMAVAQDFTAGSHVDQYYMTHDNVNQTSPPSPIDDDDILSDLAPSLLLRQQLKEIVSENTFPGCWLAIARAGRLQVELENIKGSPLPYQDVLLINQGFQSAIDDFPDYFHYRHLQKGQTKRTGSSSFSRAIIIQRNALHEQVQFRLLRLHRLHLGKGFQDEKYLPSLLACFEAAKIIIRAQIELERVITHSRTMMGYQIHLLHAALVIYLILMYEVDQRQEESQQRRLRSKTAYRLDDLEGTMELLEKPMRILRENATLTGWPRGLDRLDNFLRRVRQNQLVIPPPSPRRAAADILASIPSSSVSSSTSVSTPSQFDSTPGQAMWPHQVTHLDPISADLWSLEALFPDYATNSVDLIDSLEKFVWSS